MKKPLDSQILLGAQLDGSPLYIDLPKLIVTRLLIQANSGGGKSYLIRRLIEQAFGKIQIIVIDPEGDFATLREKFDFVLAGQGGETAADPKTAAALAIRLLELRASCVCDLYEMDKSVRKEFVKVFLKALVNAPKKLWHPVLVIVDEAHDFCPEKGTGEAVSSEEMIGLATKGRKRKFCAIFATQRPTKLRKDAAAEMLNVCVGQHFIEIDQDSACKTLGVSGRSQEEMRHTLKVMEPGTFFAFGRAISLERVQVKVGKCITTHAEAEDGKHIAPPKTPANIKALLPQLSDIPAEVEKKLATEKELRDEIATLKKLWRGAVAAQSSTAKVDPAEVRGLRSALRDLIKFIIKVTAVGIEGASEESITKAITGAVESGLGAIRKQISAHGDKLKRLYEEAEKLRASTDQLLNGENEVAVAVERSERTTFSEPKRIARKTQPVEVNADISGPEQRILNAIAWLNSIGVEDPEQTAVAFLARYTTGGGAFNNPRGRLNQRGYVEYVPGDKIRLTDEGRRFAVAPDTPLDAKELQSFVMERLPGPEQRILRVLLDHYPNAITNEDCASSCNPPYAIGGAYNNPRGRLRSLGLIEYVGGKLRAKPLLFLEER